MNENINDNCLLEVKLPGEFIRSPSSTSLNGLIKPSRFFLRSDSEFWGSHAKTRRILVQSRTTIKDRIHKTLDNPGFQPKPALNAFLVNQRHYLF